VISKKALPRLVSALAVGTAVAWATLEWATWQWGQRGAPDVHVPQDGQALGFSYSVDIATPGWVWPAAVLAGGTAAGAASVLIQRLALLRGQHGERLSNRA
jgi:hypothetical protein